MEADSVDGHGDGGALMRPGDVALQYALNAMAPNTRRAYRSCWRHFSAWCAERGVAPVGCPPAAMADYFASRARLDSTSQLHVRLAAIRKAHHLSGHENWTMPVVVSATVRGVVRAHGKPVRKSAALVSDDIRKLLLATGEGRAGARDRALLLLGFAGALRRSELVAVDVEHLTVAPGGLVLLIPDGKGDAAHEGDRLTIPRGKRAETCPVAAVLGWIEYGEIERGAVFRNVDVWGNVGARLSSDGVRKVLVRLAERAGVTAPAGERMSPHGLRAGFVTECYRAGALDATIMEHTRHKSVSTMRGYVRASKLGVESAATLLDL